MNDNHGDIYDFLNTILSFIGCVLTLLFTYYLDRRRSKIGKETSISWIAYAVSVFIGAGLGLLLGIFIVSPSLNPAPKDVITTIDTPKEGSTVNQKNNISGTAKNTPSDRDLWIFTYPLESASYHPQPGPVLLNSNGQCNGIAYVGTPDNRDSGKQFNLILTMSDQNATIVLKNYLNNSGQKKSYSGFSTLPKNVISLHQVMVIRK